MCDVDRSGTGRTAAECSGTSMGKRTLSASPTKPQRRLPSPLRHHQTLRATAKCGCPRRTQANSKINYSDQRAHCPHLSLDVCTFKRPTGTGAIRGTSRPQVTGGVVPSQSWAPQCSTCSSGRRSGRKKCREVLLGIAAVQCSMPSVTLLKY